MVKYRGNDGGLMMDSLCINVLCFFAGAAFIYLLGLLDKLYPSPSRFPVPIYGRKRAPFSKEIAEQLRKERVLYDFKQLAQKLEVENKANAIVAEFKARVS